MTLDEAISVLRAMNTGHRWPEDNAALTLAVKKLEQLLVLTEAADAVSDALDKCAPSIASICIIAQAHGAPFQGPGYYNELRELRFALKQVASEAR